MIASIKQEELPPFTMIVPSRNNNLTNSTLSAITISDDFDDDDYEISLRDNDKKEYRYDDVRSTSIDEEDHEDFLLQEAMQRTSDVVCCRFSSSAPNSPSSGPMHKPERKRSIILMASIIRRGSSSAESYLDNNNPSGVPPPGSAPLDDAASQLLKEIRQQQSHRSDRSLLSPASASDKDDFKNTMPPLKPARQITGG